MDVIRAAEYGPGINEKMSGIFVDGFFQWLKYFSKDKEKLRKTFSHIFNLDVFHVAVIDGEPAGIAACTDGKEPSVRLDRKEFTRHLGPLMGRIANSLLRKEFEEKKYPFDIETGMGMVEFVATAEKHRGHGAATAILNGIHERTPYDVYALEVADTNTAAVNLYTKLGYSEFLRVRESHGRRSGINYLVYMRYDRKSGS